MKIAIVAETFLPSTDGVITRLTACIRHYLKKGHDVRVIAPDLGVYEFEGAEIAGVPAYTLPFYRSQKFALPNRKVKRLLAEYNPDIVHAVNPALVGLSGVYYAKKLGYPLIASYHTNVVKYAKYYGFPFLEGLLWRYFRCLHNQAKLNVCTSKAMQQELIARGFHNVRLWKRGVDTELFSPGKFDADMRAKLSLNNPEKTVLLYVGRLAPEKEIEKIKFVLEKSDEFALAIVGDGPHRQALEKHFAGTNTVFTGFLHGEQLAKAYASSDVFVFPSTTETLGLVILEAMASGLPVVAAKSGPTCEQIKDDYNGLLYDPKNPDDFVAVVLRLRDETLRKRLADAALQEVSKMSWTETAEQMLHYYREVIGEEDDLER